MRVFCVSVVLVFRLCAFVFVCMFVCLCVRVCVYVFGLICFLFGACVLSVLSCCRSVLI